MIVWLTRGLALAIHERQLSEHGGGIGVRDENLLESALARPQQLFAYGDPAPDLAALAASLACALANNHPFVDGSKRTAHVAYRVFLALNDAELQASGAIDRMRAQGREPIRTEVLPRVVAGLLAGITLAALSSVVALIVAYCVGYGFTVSGLPAYTRMFGQVFTPAVCLILVVKTVLFSMAVSLIPMASALYGLRGLYGQNVRTSTELHSLVRMFALVLLIEAASLVGNYY